MPHSILNALFLRQHSLTWWHFIHSVNIQSTKIVMMLNCLKAMLAHWSMKVRWNGLLSEPFIWSNGLKQGDALFPTRICVYFDELLRRLESWYVGCHLDHHFLGALSYADDVAIIAPTIAVIRIMTYGCKQSAEEHWLLPNSVKSIVLIFCNRSACHD